MRGGRSNGCTLSARRDHVFVFNDNRHLKSSIGGSVQASSSTSCHEGFNLRCTISYLVLHRWRRNKYRLRSADTVKRPLIPFSVFLQVVLNGRLA